MKHLEKNIKRRYVEYTVKAKFILNFNQGIPSIVENAMINIDDTVITAIGKDLNTDGRQVDVFDSHIIMPGLINTHTHAGMTLFRAYEDESPLDVWLNEYIWPLEAKLTAKDIEIGAKIASIEALLSGTTTINSMYWYPEAEAKAFDEIGIRAMLGPPIISGVNTLESYERLIQDWHGKNDDLTRISINPHAPYTVTSEEYQSIYEYKNNFNAKNSSLPPLHMHTHLAESRNEMDMIRQYALDNGFTIKNDVQSPTQYLDSLGILDDQMIAAHAVECDEKDMDILSSQRVGVSINPISNLKLDNNVSKITDMAHHGIKLGLGTDGPASNNTLDMFETVKITALLQKGQLDQKPGRAYNTLKMATSGGAEVLGWQEIGSLDVGKKADLIAIDIKKPHLLPLISKNSLHSLLVYSAKSSDVTDVMINGKWRVRNREVVDVNVEELYNELLERVTELFSHID